MVHFRCSQIDAYLSSKLMFGRDPGNKPCARLSNLARRCIVLYTCVFVRALAFFFYQRKMMDVWGPGLIHVGIGKYFDMGHFA